MAFSAMTKICFGFILFCIITSICLWRKHILLILLFMQAAMTNAQLLLLLRISSYLPNAYNPSVLVLFYQRHPPSASHCTCFPPSLRSLSKRHFSPAFLPCFILPLVSLMNGFTAGKVLIFIPLSDFCWLLLISNTLRKASESINKEMNTLHSAILQPSQSFTQVVGAHCRPGLHLHW